MADEETPAPRPYDVPADIPRYYGNWILPHGNKYDLALDVGYVRAFGDDGPEPEWLAQVVMTWEQAVILRATLDRRIEEFETMVGGIRHLEGPPTTIPGAEHNGGGLPTDDDEARTTLRTPTTADERAYGVGVRQP